MPVVKARASTPETPRVNRDTLRRAALYNANPVGPFLKPKLIVPVDTETLVRRDTRGIPLASEKPSAQQIAERERGFVQSAREPGRRGWYVGHANKASVYSTEPENLLRYGHGGARALQRGRLSKRLTNTEWTPKLVAEPMASAAASSMAAPRLWPDASAQPSGSAAEPTATAAGKFKRSNQSWFASQTSVGAAPALEPTPGLAVTLPASSLVEGRPREPSLRSLQRLQRTLAREADAEARFEVAVEADQRRRAEANRRAEAALLFEGLGPEARLKAMRRTDREINGGGRGGRGRRGGARAGGGGGSRVVPPPAERRRPRYCGGLTVCVEARGEVDPGEAVRRAAGGEVQRTQDKWGLLGRFHAKWYQSAADKARFSYANLAAALADASRGNADAAAITREQFTAVGAGLCGGGGGGGDACPLRAPSLSCYSLLLVPSSSPAMRTLRRRFAASRIS